MKTFHEYCVLREADENKHLRTVLISNMGLDDTINDKTGEDIPLEQLDLEEIQKTLMASALWKKLSSKVQKNAQALFNEPQNKRLGELLDILTSEPVNIGKVMGKDDETTPQAAPAGAPTPSPTPPPTAP
jgi:hypothetical protein